MSDIGCTGSLILMIQTTSEIYFYHQRTKSFKLSFYWEDQGQPLKFRPSICIMLTTITNNYIFVDWKLVLHLTLLFWLLLPVALKFSKLRSVNIEWQSWYLTSPVSAGPQPDPAAGEDLVPVRFFYASMDLWSSVSRIRLLTFCTHYLCFCGNWHSSAKSAKYLGIGIIKFKTLCYHL